MISVDPNGEVHFWDSKWRGSDTLISRGGRAHQTTKSLDGALGHVGESIEALVASGRLSPEAGARARTNAENRNVTIVTVGTGSARNGVIEQIVGGERTVVHPQRRP